MQTRLHPAGVAEPIRHRPASRLSVASYGLPIVVFVVLPAALVWHDLTTPERFPMSNGERLTFAELTKPLDYLPATITRDEMRNLAHALALSETRSEAVAVAYLASPADGGKLLDKVADNATTLEQMAAELKDCRALPATRWLFKNLVELHALELRAAQRDDRAGYYRFRVALQALRLEAAATASRR